MYYIKRMTKLMKQVNKKHQRYAVKIMEVLIQGWIEQEKEE